MTTKPFKVDYMDEVPQELYRVYWQPIGSDKLDKKLKRPMAQEIAKPQQQAFESNEREAHFFTSSTMIMKRVPKLNSIKIKQFNASSIQHLGRTLPRTPYGGRPIQGPSQCGWSHPT
jgi:hypothetical protein